jgi:hypothetical protein
MEKDLITDWSIGSGAWWWYPLYIVLAVFLSGVIRALLACVRALKPPLEGSWRAGWLTWRSRWWASFCISEDFDHHPIILGTLELLAYPILMETRHWTAIGAWLGLKTVVQWERWKDVEKGRAQYNQFLIGNALVLIFSFFVVSIHVVR